MANKSLDDYIEAAKYGNVEAMLRIGNICSKGIGVSVNYEIAVQGMDTLADGGGQGRIMMPESSEAMNRLFFICGTYQDIQSCFRLPDQERGQLGAPENRCLRSEIGSYS